MKKTTIFAVVALLCFGMAGAASAGTGDLKILLKDGNGIIINGVAYAKKGSLLDTCVTAAGQCTMKDLPSGQYTVTAKSSSGTLFQREVKKPTVKDGETVTAVLVLVKNETGAGGGSDVEKGPAALKPCFFPCECVCPEVSYVPPTPETVQQPFEKKPERKGAE